MRVLHLLSNWRWTGPAEPALSLCVALRRLGVDADFACAPGTDESVNKIVETARDLGVEPMLELYLSKHRHPIKNWLDRRTLTRILKERCCDIVHCHLDNDHRIAAGPASKLGVPLVRSSYEGIGFHGKHTMYTKLLSNTSVLIEPSHIAAEYDSQTLGISPECIRILSGAVDTDRFDPAREVPDARRWLDIPHDAFVVGIVARMQAHRHYDDFFKAVRMLVDAARNVHAIVVGRGTKQEAVGKEPVRRLGLEKHVHFPGYVAGEDYVGMLKAFDAKVYLVPGTDGTCRAVREAMAMCKPVVAADRGMLREIVDNGHNGIVFDGSAEAMYAALLSLAQNRPKARAMGHAARETALTRYSLEVQAKAMLDIYAETLGKPAP